MGGEALHVVEVGFEEEGKRQLDRLQVIEERVAEADEVAVQNRKQTVAESGRHLLLVLVAEVSQYQSQHVVGVDLFEVIFGNEGDLEGKSCYFKLVFLFFLHRTGLFIALNDDIDELLNLTGDQP